MAAEARKDSTASGLAVRSDRLHSIVFRTGMISVASSSRSMRKASKISLDASARRLHSMAYSAGRNPSTASGITRRVMTSVSENPLLDDDSVEQASFAYKIDPYAK